MSKLIVIGFLVAICLTGCDQVRLPSAETPETVPQSSEDVPATIEATIATEEAPSTSGGETIEVQSQVAGLTLADDTAELYDELPDVELLPSAIDDLAAVNAQLCGLPMKPLEDSLTLAERTGAREAEPDLIGTATINGTTAALFDFPGLVKMEPRAVLPSGAIVSGHCGATRIAKHWFVTAAHCLDDDFDEVVLIAESETLSSPLAKRVNASASVCHASYGGARGSFANDIALVRIDDESVAELSRVQIADWRAMTDPFVPFNYAEARMAGWGLTAFQGRLSDTLLSANLGIIGIGPAEIAVTSLEGAGPCIGDSGGPLFVTDSDGRSVMVGVLSLVEENMETQRFCEGEYGARYTNLQGYADWVERVIETCENGLGLCGF